MEVLEPCSNELPLSGEDSDREGERDEGRDERDGLPETGDGSGGRWLVSHFGSQSKSKSILLLRCGVTV